MTSGTRNINTAPANDDVDEAAERLLSLSVQRRSANPADRMTFWIANPAHVYPGYVPVPADLFAGYDLKHSAARFGITRAQFNREYNADCHGTANPSIMDKPVWKYMIFQGMNSFDATELLSKGPDGPEAKYGATDSKPVWCFRRMGSTQTIVADGRIVCIGGEHEDSYDPDFCIYNGMLYLIASRNPQVALSSL